MLIHGHIFEIIRESQNWNPDNNMNAKSFAILQLKN